MDVVLRGFSEADDPAIQALMDDADVRQWNPMKAADAAAWRLKWREESQDTPTGAVTWAIGDLDGGLLGTLAVFQVDRDQGTAELGYRVLAAHRGRGAASAALRLAARRVFSEQGLRRLELFHAVVNPASCRVAERAGFRLEGTLRESYVYGDGQAYDEHLHARLAGDELPDDPAGQG